MTRLTSLLLPDFFERTAGLFSRDAILFQRFVPFGGFDARSGNLPWPASPGSRLLPSLFFRPGGNRSSV